MTEYLQLVEYGKNQWWRYLLGFLLIIITTLFLGYIPAELYLDSGNYVGLTSAEIYEVQDTSDFEAVGLNKNIGLITLISSFAIGLIALLVVYRYIHKRNILLLINGFKKIRWNRIAFGFGIWATLILISSAADLLFNTEKFTFIFEWKRFLPLLAISLFLLPIQTSFEELFVRGYIMQGVANWTKTAFLPIVISSLFFALLHGANPEVEAFGWYIMYPYYFGMGFMLALITIMDRGLELALGIHAANNIMAALTITYKDAVIQTDSIWRTAQLDITIWTVLTYYAFFILVIFVVYKKFYNKAETIIS